MVLLIITLQLDFFTNHSITKEKHFWFCITQTRISNRWKLSPFTSINWVTENSVQSPCIIHVLDEGQVPQVKCRTAVEGNILTVLAGL